MLARPFAFACLLSALLIVGCVPGDANADPLVVDGASIGGPCSDTRSPGDVTVATPWCSIVQAVKAAPSGSTVFVRAGSYPHQDLDGLGSRTDYVTFEPFGYDIGARENVTIAGISTQNTGFLRFQGFHLVGDDSSGFRAAARVYQYSQNIQFIDNEMTGEGAFLQTAAHVLFQGNYIHDLKRNCSVTQVGDGGGIFLIGANSGSLLSDDIKVLGNRVDHSLQDSLNLGTIAHLVVDGNDFSTATAQCGDHTDLVQIEGGGQGPITITNNVFHDGGQFILRNATGLVIENNLILRVNQWMQLMADPGARVINNTWWGGNSACTGCGSLIIRDYASGSSWTQPPFNYTNHMNGTVIENNIMRLFANDAVPSSAYHEDFDLIYGPKQNNTGLQGAHNLYTQPTFANAAGGDYHPGSRSPAIDSADSNVAPTTDLYGRDRWDDPDIRNTGIGPIGFADRGAVELPAPPAPAAGPPVPGGGASSLTIDVKPAFTRRAVRQGIFGLRVTCSADCRLTGKGTLTFARSSARRTAHGHGKAISSRKSRRMRVFPLWEKNVTLSANKPTQVNMRLKKVSSRRLRRTARAFRHQALLAAQFSAPDANQVVTVRFRLKI